MVIINGILFILIKRIIDDMDNIKENPIITKHIPKLNKYFPNESSIYFNIILRLVRINLRFKKLNIKPSSFFSLIFLKSLPIVLSISNIISPIVVIKKNRYHPIHLTFF